MNTPRRIPLNPLIRTLMVPVAMTALVSWADNGDLVVDLPGGKQLVYRELSVADVQARFPRIGDITCAWSISDGRLYFERPCGLGVTWVESPGVLDTLARIALDYDERKRCEAAAATAKAA